MEKPNVLADCSRQCSLVESALTGMVEKGQAADNKAMQMVVGKADLVDVVTAVAETEVAVETLVSVRDKVIQATKKSSGCRSDFL